jgi:hypothetical protein
MTRTSEPRPPTPAAATPRPPPRERHRPRTRALPAPPPAAAHSRRISLSVPRAWRRTATWPVSGADAGSHRHQPDQRQAPVPTRRALTMPKLTAAGLALAEVQASARPLVLPQNGGGRAGSTYPHPPCHVSYVHDKLSEPRALAEAKDVSWPSGRGLHLGLWCTGITFGSRSRAPNRTVMAVSR